MHACFADAYFVSIVAIHQVGEKDDRPGDRLGKQKAQVGARLDSEGD